MKIGTDTAILYLGLYMNFCLYFQNLLSNLVENQYKWSAHNAVEHL